MNTLSRFFPNSPKTLSAAAIATLLAACVAAPTKPSGAMEARARLTQLQSNADLATRAPAAIKDAELAVRVAEEPQLDPAVGQYNVYIADRKVDIAKARAETALAEDQRQALTQQRDRARLDARTQEADAAASKLRAARGELADSAQAIADSARVLADSQQQNADLQRQLDEMHAKATDRGMVITIGDLLFTTNRADLKSGATENLNRLVTFLNTYTNRSVTIEGYTDSTGGSDYNMGLSQRRADSVKFYLTGQGIDGARLNATGKGESNPVADNESASGRQQNRRVDVIIVNPSLAQQR